MNLKQEIVELKEISNLLSESLLKEDGNSFSINGWQGSINYVGEGDNILVGQGKAVEEDAYFDYHIHKKSKELFILLSGEVMIEVEGESSPRYLKKPFQYTIISNKRKHDTRGTLNSQILFVEFPADQSFVKMYRRGE